MKTLETKKECLKSCDTKQETSLWNLALRRWDIKSNHWGSEQNSWLKIRDSVDESNRLWISQPSTNDPLLCDSNHLLDF